MSSFLIAFIIALAQGVLMVYLFRFINKKSSKNVLIILGVKFLLYLFALWLAMAVFPQYLIHFICGFMSAYTGYMVVYFVYRLFIKQYFNIENFIIKYACVANVFFKGVYDAVIKLIKKR